MIRYIAAFLLLVTTTVAVPASAGTIYYYKDENGVAHFTDMPTTPLFRPFLVFKDNYLRDKEKILAQVKHHSSRYDIDPLLVRAVIEIESGFQPEAVSRAGAQGLMQIMPATGAELGLTSPFDPDSNIQAGIRYLKQMINQFGTIPLALAAYNAGPNAVKRYGGIPPFAETEQYVQKVLSLYHRLRETQG
jgi:soluble lytic murein transglycosylase-like protein